MLVNVNGQWVEGGEEMPETLPWDASLQSNPGAIGDNRGCPPGYFCEYVSAASWWNPFFTVGESPAYTRVCRRADEVILNDGGVTLSQETGEGAWEASVEAAAAAAAVPVEALKDALPYVGVGLGSTALLIGAGFAAYLLLTRR
jgi:hypothetical protein